MGTRYGWRSTEYRYAMAGIVSAGSILLRISLNPILSLRAPHALIFLTAAASTWVSGLAPGLLAIFVYELVAAWLYPVPGSFLMGGDVADVASQILRIGSSVGIALIISSLRRTQEQLQQAKAEAEQANQAKERFLAVAAHELRNPLNSIALSTSLLRRGQVPDRAVAPIDRIDRAVRALKNMVDDLADSTRISAGQFRVETAPIDFVAVLTSAIEMMKPIADARKITLMTELSVGPVIVEGDPQRLMECASNLLDNALKFTPDGGTVEIATKVASDRVQAVVKDTGRGISCEFLPHVFEPFAQADLTSGSRRSGLGLGLSIVKHIIELHGGTITAQSEGENRGATFTMTLPRSAVQPAAKVS